MAIACEERFVVSCHIKERWVFSLVLLLEPLKLYGKTKEHLDAWKENGEPIEIVEANLTDEDCWADACKDCKFVAHVASPFFVGCPDSEAEEKLFKPAKKGTLNVLRAAQAAGVKRVVVTSSVAAITAGHPFQKVYEKPEEMWSDIKKADNYSKSKTMAEKAAWDFVEEQRSAGNEVFELATVNPTFVIGPPCSSGSATSHDLFKTLLNRGMPVVPDIRLGEVDVRDVAKCHRLAIETPDAAGKRFACFNDNSGFLEMAKIMKEEFEQYGYKIPTGKAPYPVLFVLSLFMKQVAAIRPRVGKESPLIANTLSKNVLGMEYISVEESVKEHVHGAIQSGVRGFHKTKQYEEYLKTAKP
uniref:3-beta hydroxysteroid dehydrogenase/isomerase domain-containing protein n=1 Tax=Aplanochytrium stocchinoi TaxID=215587 RepID=A0A7S3LRI2_9STRA